jgi:hypothetical protein
MKLLVRRPAAHNLAILDLHLNGGMRRQTQRPFGPPHRHGLTLDFHLHPIGDRYWKLADA